MPQRAETLTTAKAVYGPTTVGPAEHVLPVNVNVAALTTAEVDIKGYLKPGVVFDRLGALVGVAPAYVYGVVLEPFKVAASNVAGDLTAAGTKKIPLCVQGVVNRDIAEDNMGRAYTANEIAGFAAAGSNITLSNT